MTGMREVERYEDGGGNHVGSAVGLELIMAYLLLIAKELDE